MSKSFIFRKELLDIADSLEVCGKGLAGEFLMAAAQYGLEGKSNSNNPIIISALNNAIQYLPQPIEKSPLGGRPVCFEPELLTEMIESGYTQKEVAAHFGCSVRTVQRALKK